MKHQALSQYQTYQAHAGKHQLHRELELILKRAALYNIPMIQNEHFLEMILAMPEKVIEADKVETIELLLAWTFRAQEGAMLS